MESRRNGPQLSSRHDDDDDDDTVRGLSVNRRNSALQVTQIYTLETISALQLDYRPT